MRTLISPRFIRLATASLAVTACCLSSCCGFAAEPQPSESKPNVVLILADDLGYGDLSIMGQKKLKTPNIDRLGYEGIVFTDHYSGNTVCSPSRAVLMTGQHPGHSLCRGNGAKGNQRYLDPAMVTLPRLFKNAGYATGAFGKWGLGTTSEAGRPNPMTHGFDVFSGWKSQMIAHTYYPTSIVRNGKEVPLDGDTYVHDLIMDDALGFIRSSIESETPFFAYIPTAVPHAAMHAPKALHEKWRKVFPQFDTKVGRYGAGPGETCPPVINPIAGFAAMMENLDNQVGELLALLNELGVDDNTLVIFVSDNGAHREGGHDPLFWDSNGPLRGIKRDLYEGGIRTPLLARWSGTIKPGSSSNHISAFWDFLPTAAELIGQPIPEQVDGLSFLPALTGNSTEQKRHGYLYWEFTKGPAQAINKTALRQGDWKAVQVYRRGKQQPMELFNLKDDLGEENNLVTQHPEIAERLEGLMRKAHHPLKPEESPR
jgi:arylsulfatase A-like enzyme